MAGEGEGEGKGEMGARIPNLGLASVWYLTFDGCPR